MSENSDHGGEAPCWAHFVDELDQVRTSIEPLGSNTIIYCDDWTAIVEFYRNGFGLRATMERDWFVEFELHAGAHLSVADASHATVDAGTGAGITLSWRVADVVATREHLVAQGVDASPIRQRWGADTCFVFDPAGNRIEFWTGR